MQKNLRFSTRFRQAVWAITFRESLLKRRLHSSFSLKKPLLLLLLGIFLPLYGLQAADTYLWIGPAAPATGDWATAANWQRDGDLAPRTTPANTDILLFRSSAAVTG